MRANKTTHTHTHTHTPARPYTYSQDFAKGGPLSYELEAVEPYRIESALESMRAEAWGNCLHAAGHLAWWASMQPDAPWRAHEQVGHACECTCAHVRVHVCVCVRVGQECILYCTRVNVCLCV